MGIEIHLKIIQVSKIIFVVKFKRYQTPLDIVYNYLFLITFLVAELPYVF